MNPAPLTALSGSTKINLIQNVILLHRDLHDVWDSYNFAVNPNVCIFLNLSMVSLFTMSFHSVGMWSFHLFPAMMILLEMSLNWITLLMIFCLAGVPKNIKGTSEPGTTRMHLVVAWICWDRIFGVKKGVRSTWSLRWLPDFTVFRPSKNSPPEYFSKSPRWYSIQVE